MPNPSLKVTLPPALRERIVQIAEHNSVSHGAVIRTLLARALEQEDAEAGLSLTDTNARVEALRQLVLAQAERRRYGGPW